MNRPNLKDKAAIVTGAGRGIGRAIARRLAGSGAAVAAVARTASEVNETRRLIESAGGQALAVAADVTRESDVERLVQEAHEAFGRIDMLVNNAGIAPLAGIDDMTPATFDAILATNIRAVYLCSRAAWPHLAQAGGGAIVNMSSVASFDPFPGFAAYGAAKAFVNVYTKALAAEGAPKDIRVYAVAPGAVETTMLRERFPDFPRDKTLAPDDVAVLVESLLSPECRRESGQTITIRKD